jgi:uncharacterized coiled-coil protein SlyX
MENLSFAEKNNFVVKNKSGNYFSKDLELFKKHFPIHKLNNELARANSFTYDRLDGQMLYVLLEKIAPEEILKNREEKTVENPVKAIIESINQAKEKLIEMGIDPEKVSPEFLQTNIGLSIESFTELYESLKEALKQDGNVIHTLSIIPPAEGTETTGSSTENLQEEESKTTGTVTESPVTQETEFTGESSSVENLKVLEERIVDLEEKTDINEDEISGLRDELEDRDTSIEELQKKTEALEKKAFNKKKASRKSSLQ